MAKITKPDKNKTPIVVQRDFPFKRGSTYYIKFPNGDGTFKELEYPSVTTILSGTADKQALISWATKEAAKVALSNPGMSIEEVSAAVTARKTSAIDIGKAIHKFAEDYSLGKDMLGKEFGIDTLDPALKPYAEAFLSFIDLHKPRVLFTEVCVFNVTHGYAGTADLIAVMSNGKTAILDWKTGKNTYKDNHLQQMAYAKAEYIYTSDHKVTRMPEIHEQYLVHLKDNGTAHLIPVKEPFEHFLKSLAFYPTAKYRAQWW